ncbi:MAG: NrfD/PsrC family molybdoenzyme membrane anchor subunit [Symbiobacteriia bacterium]
MAATALKAAPLSAPATNPRTARSRGGMIWYAVLTLIALGGLGAIAYRAYYGLATTHLTTQMPWGAWVAFYIFFVGLSAGAFLLSSMVYVFGMEQFEKVGRVALLSAIISMFIALAFIGLDLGRMDRALNAMIYFNWTSPLAWEVRFYAVYIALLIGELWLSMRQDLVRQSQGTGLPAKVAGWLTFGRTDLSVESGERDHRWLKILGTIGVPIAIFGVHGGTGTIFAIVKARAIWFGGLFPVIFILSALVSGTALITVIAAVRDWVAGRRLDEKLIFDLGRVLLLFLFIDLGLEFYEFLVAGMSLIPHELETLKVMTTSHMAWSFWGVQLLLGGILPAILLLQPRRSAKTIIAAAAMVVVGIIGVRFNIVVPPLVTPVLEGLPQPDYVPSLIEWVSSAGLFSLALLMLSVANELLPLDPSQSLEVNLHE